MSKSNKKHIKKSSKIESTSHKEPTLPRPDSMYGKTKYKIEVIIHPNKYSAQIVHQILDVNIPLRDEKDETTLKLPLIIPNYVSRVKVIAINANNKEISYHEEAHINDQKRFILFLLLSDFPKIKIKDQNYLRVKLEIEYLCPEDCLDNFEDETVHNHSVLINRYEIEPWHFIPEIVCYFPIEHAFQPEFMITLPLGWEIDDTGCYIDANIGDGGDRIEFSHRIIVMKQNNKKLVTFLLDSKSRTIFDKHSDYISTGVMWYKAKMTMRAKMFQSISHIFPFVGILAFISLLLGIRGYIDYMPIASISLTYLLALFAYYYTFMSLSGIGFVFTNKKWVYRDMIISVVIIMVLIITLIIFGIVTIISPDIFGNVNYFKF